MTDWIQLIRAEYLEIPGLHLTKPQVQTLWNLERAIASRFAKSLKATSIPACLRDDDATVALQTMTAHKGERQEVPQDRA